MQGTEPGVKAVGIQVTESVEVPVQITEAVEVPEPESEVQIMERQE